jgi:hypothetical protein
MPTTSGHQQLQSSQKKQSRQVETLRSNGFQSSESALVATSTVMILGQLLTTALTPVLKGKGTVFKAQQTDLYLTH